MSARVAAPIAITELVLMRVRSSATVRRKNSQCLPYSLDGAHTDEHANALGLSSDYASHQSDCKRQGVDELGETT